VVVVLKVGVDVAVVGCSMAMWWMIMGKSEKRVLMNIDQQCHVYRSLNELKKNRSASVQFYAQLAACQSPQDISHLNSMLKFPPS
jgi:hypothetical protein